MDFTIIVERDILALFLQGLLTTLKLLGISLAFGLLISIPLAVLRVSRHPLLAWPVWAYTYILRGTPMLLQLYLIYYGLSQFAAIRESFAWPWLSDATFCTALAFILNTSAYTTELIAGALRNIPHGEIEAARSYGMSKRQMYRHVLLPAALRRSLPAYSNEVLMMLHGTSLASTVTLLDLTAAADRVYATYYMPFEPFVTAGLLYLALTLVLLRLFWLAERRWLAYLQPRGA
ncbi:MAG TPA: ABC transporter permease subunit [Candidatus Competibacteraceae bacterium]|nr:ABC transporter permease subunit [Candidatus Competibacteraceae bacterium]